MSLQVKIYTKLIEVANDPPASGQVYIIHLPTGDGLDFIVEVEGTDYKGMFFTQESASLFAEALALQRR